MKLDTNGEAELPRRIEIRLDEAYSHNNFRPRYNNAASRQGQLSVTQKNLIESDFEPKVKRQATFRTGSRLRTANSTKITVQDVMQTSVGTDANNLR